MLALVVATRLDTAVDVDTDAFHNVVTLLRGGKLVVDDLFHIKGVGGKLVRSCATFHKVGGVALAPTPYGIGAAHFAEVDANDVAFATHHRTRLLGCFCPFARVGGAVRCALGYVVHLCCGKGDVVAVDCVGTFDTSQAVVSAAVTDHFHKHKRAAIVGCGSEFQHRLALHACAVVETVKQHVRSGSRNCVVGQIGRGRREVDEEIHLGCGVARHGNVDSLALAERLAVDVLAVHHKYLCSRSFQRAVGAERAFVGDVGFATVAIHRVYLQTRFVKCFAFLVLQLGRLADNFDIRQCLCRVVLFGCACRKAYSQHHNDCQKQYRQ